MRRAVVVLVGIALVAPPAAAQPRQPAQLRSFGLPGGGPSLGESQVAHWAGQLALEVRAFRAEVGQLPRAGTQRFQLAVLADRAATAADAFHALSRQTRNLDRLRAEHEKVDPPLRAMANAARPFEGANPGLAQALARAQYADVRLHTALAGGNNADGKREAAVRLANALEAQAEQLRAVVNAAANGREVSRSLRAFAVGSRNFADALQKGRPLAQSAREFADLTAIWQSAGQEIAQLVASRPAVRVQAARVDGLVRELGQLLGAGPIVDPGFGIIPAKERVFVVGAGEGGGPHVRVFHDLKAGPSAEFFAYDPNFRGGVRVAVADLTGDGFPEVITAPGKGMPPLVRVFDGRDLKPIAEFLAYDEAFRLGVYVAAADLTRRNQALVAVGAGEGGGAHVRMFDLVTGKEVYSEFVHPPELPCGVRVALGDVNGDGFPDLVTAPGPAAGAGPMVQVFDGKTGKQSGQFNAADARWRGGLFVATADLTRNGRAEILVGTDGGGAAVVKAFDAVTRKEVGRVTPFPPAFRGGARVAAFDFNGDGALDVVVAPGPGQIGEVRIFDGKTRAVLTEFTPFAGGFAGGAFVAGR